MISRRASSGFWLLAVLLVSQVVAWGQDDPLGLRNRNQATRVQTPSAVVQASAHVPAASNRTEPIPLKSASDPQASRIAASRSHWSTTLSTLVSLAVVVFLFLGASMVLRKAQPKQFQKLPKDVVEVLGRTSIAPRQNLVVIRFGSKLVLVSQQPGETRTITEVHDPDEVGRLIGLCESHRPESISNSFRDVLHQVVPAKPSRAV
jgi:flagellar biogenesis protein FliO